MNVNDKSILKKHLVRLLVRAILFLFLLLTVYPFLWNLYSSFKTNTEFLDNAFSLPTSMHWENYVRALEACNIGQYIWNSLYVVVLSLALTLVCVVPCSYCLVRYKFPGSSLIMKSFMACLFISGNYILMPLFLQMNRLHLLNKLNGLVLVYAAFRIPFSVFLLSGYMRGIPREYEEAAIVDGCSPFGVLRNVIIPLSRSGIITISMLTVMASWNEYVMAMVLVTDPDKKTLPVGLAALQAVQEYATDWVALFAGMVIAIIPTFIIYIMCKKYLMQGLNVGGLKG